MVENMRIAAFDFQYYSPTKIIHQVGAIKRIGAETLRFARKALVVCLKDMEKSGMVEETHAYLDDAGVEAFIFAEIEPNPGVAAIDRGAAVAKAENAGVVIAVGGGSAIDAAKGIAVLAAHPAGETVWDFIIGGRLGSEVVTGATLPIIAVPTTAGTGSEATLGAVISNPKTRTKECIGSTHIFPRLALVDPALMVGLPPMLTAATGLDALTQSIEGFISVRANPVSDALALKSIELIAANLRGAVFNGNNLAARSAVALGATLSGMVLSQAGVGAVHALAMALGGQFGIGHGLAISLLLGGVMEHNVQADFGKFARLALALGERTDRLSAPQAAHKAVDALKIMVKDVGINQRLRDLGVRREDLPGLAESAVVHPDMGPNPRKLTVAEIEKIYQAAW